MANNILQLNEFFVEGGNQEKSHVLLHITEPSTPAEEEKGYFFAICEINNSDNQLIVRMQNIIDEIEQQYYESSIGSGKHPLEAVLEKINQENFTLAREKDTTLNCVVGVIARPEVVFSFHGRPQILIFYKNREGYYHRMDLAGANEQEIKDDKQIFSQIVQGKISPADFLFISTPRVADYFSQDRLQKIVTSRPTRQSAEHLERVLSELRNNCSYGGLIVHLENKETADDHLEKTRPSQNSGSARSLDRLYDTELNTANTLSPSMLGKVNQRLQSFVKNTPQFINKMEDDGEKTIRRTPPARIGGAHLRTHRPFSGHGETGIDYRHLLVTALRFTWQALKYLGQALAWLGLLLWTITAGLARFLSAIFYLATNIGNRRRTIINQWSQNWKNYRDHFKNLPLATKILFLSSVVLVIIFAFSVTYISYKKEKAAQEQQFNQQIQTIKEKKDSAESYMTYNNDAQATGEIREAKRILLTVDCVLPAHNSACEELTRQIEKLSLRIRKEQEANPELIYDWGFKDNPLTGLTRVNNKIIAFGQNTPDLFIFDLLTKTTALIKTNNSVSGFTAAAVPKENDYALFVYNKNKLLQYNPEDNSVKTINVSFPSDNAEISGMVLYNRRLYALDRANGQIYRHDNIQSGFAAGKPWIKDGVKLVEAVDITIDGDVFVLSKSGAIDKFNAGVKQESPPLIIEPPLENGDRIWTYNDLRFVYILDSDQKRLLIINRDGRLEKQLTSEDFTDPLGFSVDEESQTAYILNENKLYKIGL